MVYNPKKPDSGPSPQVDVSQIQNNFSEFSTLFAINHTPLNDPNQGDHEAIVFQLQTVDPEVTEDLVALYSKSVFSTASTQPQLFVRIKKFLPTSSDSNNKENTPMQLTYHTVNTAGPYQSFLAGGYVLYMGTTNDITVNITLTPPPTRIVVASAAPNNTVVGGVPFDVSTNIISTNQFKINSIDATGVYTFRWMAIAIA